MLLCTKDNMQALVFSSAEDLEKHIANLQTLISNAPTLGSPLVYVAAHGEQASADAMREWAQELKDSAQDSNQP